MNDENNECQFTEHDFQNWFLENLSLMASLGIYHYNAPAAIPIKAVLSSVMPEIKKINNRLDKLESKGKRGKKIG